MSKAPAFDVNTSLCSDNCCPPLFFAVGGKSKEAPAHEDCLAFVLGLPGVNVNLQNRHGITALRFAVHCGEVACVKLLLCAPSIDVNKLTIKDQVALHTAVDQCHLECIELLLQASGIKINMAEQGTLLCDVCACVPHPSTHLLRVPLHRRFA